ncbi:MAG: hypothetical protein EHM39_05340, partial [Chloroflexi bacterium]
MMGYYAAARLIGVWWRERRNARRVLRPVESLLVMVLLGLGLGAVQFIPLYELGTRNFRAAAASFAEVRGYAFPARHIAKFVMPNAYGSPAQHEYRDVFSWEMVAHDWQRPCDYCPTGFERVTNTDFGIKNYVEGGAYMGILVLVLAGIGLFAPRGSSISNERQASPPQSPSPAELERGKRGIFSPLHSKWRGAGGEADPPYRLILVVLALISLTFAFGLPTYALLYYAFPNINQLHTPFRWVWPLTFCVAALAAFGADALDRARRDEAVFRPAKWIGYALIGLGTAVLIGLLISRVAYGTFEPL